MAVIKKKPTRKVTNKGGKANVKKTTKRKYTLKGSTTKPTYQKKTLKQRKPGSGRPGGNPDLRELGEPYRWKKGQSGNPEGRPKKNQRLGELLRRQLSIPAEEFKPAKRRAKELGLSTKNLTVGDVFALSLLEDGMQGREGLIKEIFNRVDGKEPDIIKGEINGNGFEMSLNNLSDDQLRGMIRKNPDEKAGGTKDESRRSESKRDKKRVSKTKRS